MMFTGVCFAQNVYKYDNLTLTGQSTSDKMDVQIIDGNEFSFSDSLINIEVTLEGRNIQSIMIHNMTEAPVIIRYKGIVTLGKYFVKGGFAKSKYYDQSFNISEKLSDITDPSKGEEVVYPDGLRMFVFPIPKMPFVKAYYFNTKPENITVDLFVPLVVNGREKTYEIRFTGHNS